MLRMRLANGVITSGQMRMLAEVVQHYDEGNADITTGKISNCGEWIEDVPDISSRSYTWSYLAVRRTMCVTLLVRLGWA